MKDVWIASAERHLNLSETPPTQYFYAKEYPFTEIMFCGDLSKQQGAKVPTEPSLPDGLATHAASGHLTYSLNNAHEGLVDKWDCGNPGFHLISSQVLHRWPFRKFCRLLQLRGSQLTRGQQSNFQTHCCSAPELPGYQHLWLQLIAQVTMAGDPGSAY